MKLRLFLSPRAEKDLKKLERSVLVKIDRVFLLLAENPYPPGAKALSDKRLAQFRIRVGEHRVLYDFYPKDNAVYIIRIGHRKDIYR